MLYFLIEKKVGVLMDSIKIKSTDEIIQALKFILWQRFFYETITSRIYRFIICCFSYAVFRALHIYVCKVPEFFMMYVFYGGFCLSFYFSYRLRKIFMT